MCNYHELSCLQKYQWTQPPFDNINTFGIEWHLCRLHNTCNIACTKSMGNCFLAIDICIDVSRVTNGSH